MDTKKKVQNAKLHNSIRSRGSFSLFFLLSLSLFLSYLDLLLRPVSSKKNNEENPLQKKKISRPPGPKKEENTEENLDLVSPRCTIIIRRVCTISFSPPSTFYPPIPPLPLRVPPLFLFVNSSIRSPSAPTSFFHPTRSSLCAHSRLFILLEVRNPPAPTPFHPTSSSSRSSP